MKERVLVLGILVMRTVIAVMSLPQSGGQENADYSPGQERYAHRIAQIRKSLHDVNCYGDGLINDILAISNREIQVEFLRLFAQNVKAMPSANLDLSIRHQELRRCNHLTECACNGFRQIGGHADDIWDLHFALLSRYVNVTNNCKVKWDEIVRYDVMKRKEREATGKISYVGSGPILESWPKYFARMLDAYLMEVWNRWYRIDTRQLSAEDKRKVKSTIEQIVGREFDLSKPVQLCKISRQGNAAPKTESDVKVDVGDL